VIPSAASFRPGDLGVDRLGHDVDPRLELGVVLTTYSADSAWFAKLMSMTAAGWPSAGAEVDEPALGDEVDLLPPRSNSWTFSRASRTWPSAISRSAFRSSSASKWPSSP
jgi:hypothetical protein